MKRFDNKVVIVTGAGTGIGYEIARKFAQEGAAVVLNDLDETLTKKAAGTIEKEGGICMGIAGDAGNVAFINELVDKTVDRFKRLDIAIPNAGITLFDSFLEYSEEKLQKVIQLNIVGSFFLLQAASKAMIRQQIKGKLIVMSSVTGHQAHKDLAAYGLTKAGLEMLAKSLVMELSPYGININGIAPGATKTERTVSEINYESVWSQITPMGRPAATADIANVALFLASGDADHITGQTIIVDGGWTSVSPGPESVST
ncbi:MAG: SDR family oxidoreductase [Cyclobacteriaceae bacterium]